MKLLNIIVFVFLTCLSKQSHTQSYTSYHTGNSEDIVTEVTFGICLTGGNTEHDEAMKKLLLYSGGGDIVVLRATGSDGYNNYLYSQLGIEVNSVETLVIPSREAAEDEYVEQQIRRAEAIWIAGGNQFQYIDHRKNTSLHNALNNGIYFIQVQTNDHTISSKLIIQNL